MNIWHVWCPSSFFSGKSDVSSGRQLSILPSGFCSSRAWRCCVRVFENETATCDTEHCFIPCSSRQMSQDALCLFSINGKWWSQCKLGNVLPSLPTAELRLQRPHTSLIKAGKRWWIGVWRESPRTSRADSYPAFTSAPTAFVACRIYSSQAVSAPGCEARGDWRWGATRGSRLHSRLASPRWAPNNSCCLHPCRTGLAAAHVQRGSKSALFSIVNSPNMDLVVIFTRLRYSCAHSNTPSGFQMLCTDAIVIGAPGTRIQPNSIWWK